jgi:hypothetical protein
VGKGGGSFCHVTGVFVAVYLTIDSRCRPGTTIMSVVMFHTVARGQQVACCCQLFRHSEKLRQIHEFRKKKNSLTNQSHRIGHLLRSFQLCSCSRTSQHFMKPGGSLPCSQEPSTGPYPEPDQSNPSYLSKIHFNIVYPSTSWSSQWSLPSGFPTNILYAFLFSPIRATCPVYLTLLHLIILIILGEEYQL